MKFKLLRALARCIAALAVGTALFSVSAASRQEHTTNSRVQKGRAAFYSPVLEGHKTACGGRYVASELTTAHRSLPCGTRVRITNTKNVSPEIPSCCSQCGWPGTRKRSLAPAVRMCGRDSGQRLVWFIMGFLGLPALLSPCGQTRRFGHL
jgi:hypothetical protein